MSHSPQTQSEKPQSLWTIREVGRRCGVSIRTVRRWKRLGLLPFVELPFGSIRFDGEDVEAFITLYRRIQD